MAPTIFANRSRRTNRLRDAKGDWAPTHDSAKQDQGVEGSWVHAYLHRKECNQGNAACWYRRAGKSVCRGSADEEWISILRALLGSELL
jgi:ribosomal protein L20